ncbi:carbonic anhydrase [Heliobacterium chlorum]|uniref:carbonic anhydrase n=1 Tax=Heliobacterium chlorum TaxID=2698 RepID=A0ABR7T2L1_HELCL|nr:carbonic anhydrase [Heliobacterium chlorum]MBC9785015.1 carbonic anhydrase [Heliobacterium chlorum]
MGWLQGVNQKVVRGVLISAVTAAFIVSGCSSDSDKVNQPKEVSSQTQSISKEEARKQLTLGNERFQSGKVINHDLSEQKHLELAKAQHPFAIVLSCSDSRVPPELVFDQGLGDLFVVRSAGHVLSPEAIGSIEYAVEHFHTPYLVVLGHESCGAVKATVEGGHPAGSIGAVTDHIKPVVENVKTKEIAQEELTEKVADENVRQTVAALRKSPVIADAIANGKLAIAGAKYQMISGKVNWLD